MASLALLLERTLHSDCAMFERLFARIIPATLQVSPVNACHLPLVLFAYACLLPRELTIEVLDAALLPYRIVLIAMVPFAIGNIARYPIRLSLIDLVVAFAALWVPIALYKSTSLDAGLISGGSFALDMGLAYLIGRSAIRTPQDFRTVFLCFMPGLLVVVGILAMESVSHQMILRPLLATMMGVEQPEYLFSIRFGLLRAMGPFPHPILGGVFLAGILPIAWYLSHNVWQRLIGCGIALGAIFTVSSAAIIGMLLGASLIFLDIVQRLSRLPVFLASGFYTMIMVIVIAVTSQNGLVPFLIRRLTFDPDTGYYRMLIWEYGGAEAMGNPLYGIGQRDWIRPIDMPNDSIDAYWLLLAMLYGFPAVAAVLLAMVGAIVALLRTQKFRHAADQDCAKGIVFFIIIVVFSGLTVHLWENVHAWIIGVLGGAVSLATQARTVPAPRVVAAKGGAFSWVVEAFKRPRVA